MVQTGQVTHSESTAYSQYTVAGDTAAQNSNIFVSSSTATTDDQSIDWWMGAPFHAMAMVDPRLSSTGFGSYRNSAYSPWQMGAAVDTSRGNSGATGLYTNPVFFPGNLTTEPLTSYSGNESPNPQAACPGYSGLPLFIEIGGNVSTTAGAHTLTANGGLLANCVIDANNASFTSYLKWRGGVILMPQQALVSGTTYTVALTVNAVPYTWSFKVGGFVPSVTVAPNTGPTAGGTTVTVTGTGFTNGTTSVRFGATAAASYSVVNDTTITAASPAHAAGTVDVTVTNATGTSGTSGLDQFTFGACASVTASAAPASPAASGSQISITGAAAGCSSPLYEFWMMAQGSSTWQLVQGYSSSASFRWNSTGALAGTETFSVWARDANSAGLNGGSMGSYDTFAGIPFTVTTSVAGACTAITATSTPVTSAASGTQVSIAGAASGCPNARYEFWMKAAGTSTWQLLGGYTTSATYTWNSTGALGGTETFGVWARDATSTATYDTYASLPFTITTGACTSVTATASPTTATHGTGAQVTITGVGAGCTTPRYEFWMKAAGSSTWQLLRGYTTSATYTWNTTGAPTGTEQFGVWVRDASSGASYDSYVSLPFTLS
jgi:hypothetical protein